MNNLSTDALLVVQPVQDNSGERMANHPVEDQLAHIITSAREVAIVAEELLREFSARETILGAAASQQTPHAISLAPRLLAATEQQLLSLLAMMRTI